MSADPWFVAAFGADYVDVYPHRDTRAARAEIAFLAGQGLHGRILDLCCGFGRHTLALRERGLDAIGLDLSAELLRHARETDAGALLTGRLLRADARAVPCADASFDCVVNLFSSFGYFGAAGDALVLSEIARTLKNGGAAFLDLMNPERVRAGLVSESRTERGASVLHERRHLADGGRRVVKDVEIVHADGSRRTWREDVRLYEAEELQPAFARLGLELMTSFGDFTGGSRSVDAPRQILVLRRSVR